MSADIGLLGIMWLVLVAGEVRASEGGLMSIDLGLMIWTWVSFLILLYLLGRFAYRPMMFLVERREKRIRDSLRQAEDEKRNAEAVTREREALLKETQEQAGSALEGAREAAEGQKRRIIAEAREEAGRIIKQAEAEIQREKRQAMVELSESVADLAIEAAERIVRSELDRNKHQVLVDEFITDLENKSIGH